MILPESPGTRAQKFIEVRYSPQALCDRGVVPMHVRSLVDAFGAGSTSLTSFLQSLGVHEAEVRSTFDFLAQVGILIPHHDPAVLVHAPVEDAVVRDAPSYSVSRDILHPDPV